MNLPDITLLIVLFFIIAVFYSSVGFGGGSSYTATLAILAVPYTFIPQISLLCNIVVVAGGSYIFHKKGFLQINKIWPILLGSIPMAFAGGMVHVEKDIYFGLLGFILLISGAKLAFNFSFLRPKQFFADSADNDYQKKNSAKRCPRNNQIHKNHRIHKNEEGQNEKHIGKFTASLIGGAVVGFVSGMVGIGGGILLAPFLHLTRWGKAREISSATSFFILLNSISGLLGQVSKNQFNIDLSYIVPLGLAVFLGGQIGARLGSIRFSEIYIRKATGALVLFVSLRIMTQLY